ncbi:hypothetical protein P691DRAFT_779266 [Macrolepiota fuliginosa MF-IS2]|uniref:Uncharacterized protein n=1 Tax=Macrolepiota fuliginosa MF-IS2 TaxID=1400762 RepID=A0A9P6BYQ8_9AGAR|nr:hypothetical protein P691DRAFT_779266 [Macrolepiota fuliginosa MF-IS2]
MASGTYKIVYKSGHINAARVFHPTQTSRIFIDGSDKGDLSKWRVSTVRGPELGWCIRNIGTEDLLFTDANPGARLIGKEGNDQDEITWKLEAVGKADTYRIFYPDTDLVWTAVPSPLPGRDVHEVFLQANIGAPEQEFKFVILSSD